MLVDHLKSAGIEVVAVGRKDLESLSPSRKASLDGTRYIRQNMQDLGQLIDVLGEGHWGEDNECVFFNLAWGGLNSLSDVDARAQLRNVGWSLQALETAKILGCFKFIQVGTMEEVFAERYMELDHNLESKFNRHIIYAAAKIVARNALRLRAQEIGLDFIYVRNSHVMGPEDDKDSFLQVTLQKLLSGGDLVFSSGEQYFDVLSVYDCAKGYLLAATHGLPGEEYWVGSGAPRKLRDYVEEMYRLFPSGQKMRFGELSYEDVVIQKDVFSIDLLRQHTGYSPDWEFKDIVRDLEESLRGGQRI